MEQFDSLLTQKFRFAKTYINEPHFYIVRDYLLTPEKKLFDEFAIYIREHGYTKRWWSSFYTYINIGHHKYRVMGNILNRVPLDEETLRKDLAGQNRGGVSIETIVMNWKKGFKY